MADTPQWGPEPNQQAAFLNDFKKQTAAELAAIKARLIWLLMPSFLILIAVLGLSLFTFHKVNELQVAMEGSEQTLKGLKKSMKQLTGDDQQLRPIYLNNGLTDTERAEFYHLAEGSEVYPLTWLKALENENGKPFLQDLERLGFLPDPDNKDGLPVGLTSGVTIGLEPLGPMVGLNCAACHVGELHYKDKRVRIDGAPNLVNTREFFKSLIDSALGTAKDPAKLLAFVIRVKQLEEKSAGVEPSRIRSFARQALVKVVQTEEDAFKAVLLPAIKKFIDAEEAAGAKPFDFKAALKEGVQDEKSFRAKLVKDLKLEGVAELAKKSKVLSALKTEVERHGAVTHTLEDIYISLRLLRARAIFLQKLGPVGLNDNTNWGPGRVDAFGSARTFLFDDKYLPVNPVSYPPIFELKSHGWFHYDNNTNTFLERNFGQALGVGALYDKESGKSTLQTQNLRKLETLARKLSAPKWPEEVFGHLDAERVKKGAKLYEKYCASCHNPKDGEPFVELFKLEAIDTDTGRANSFAAKLPDGTPFFEKIRDTMLEIKKIEVAKLPEVEQAEIAKEPVEWRGPNLYSARTLKGAWATAPYLHNGSVPTLDDLLKPAKDRPKEFYVGGRQFDVDKLGYMNDEKATLYKIATPGNSNRGHEGDNYGTGMSADDRKDLLEYLKSL